MEHAICAAIQGKQIVSFTYKGVRRSGEPHALFIDQDGDLTLSVWQTSGGKGPGWRDFHVSKLTAFATGPATFARPRQDYNLSAKKPRRIICSL